MDRHSLCPAQLRKLVQARKEGDEVKLVFYRAGKKETASAALAKAAEGFDSADGKHPAPQKLHELQKQLKELAVDDAIREQMQTLRDSLGSVQFDQKKVKEEVRHSMEVAERAFKDALREATNANLMLGPARKALEELVKSGVAVDNDATVTVRSTGKSAKSLVKADDSGTIVIVSNPKLHLTAHDKRATCSLTVKLKRLSSAKRFRINYGAKSNRCCAKWKRTPVKNRKQSRNPVKDPRQSRNRKHVV